MIILVKVPSSEMVKTLVTTAVSGPGFRSHHGTMYVTPAHIASHLMFSLATLVISSFPLSAKLLLGESTFLQNQLTSLHSYEKLRPKRTVNETSMYMDSTMFFSNILVLRFSTS